MPQAAASVQALHELERLWSFNGRAEQFWSEMLETFCSLVGAASAVLVVREVRSGVAWRGVGTWPNADETRQRVGELATRIGIVAALSVADDAREVGVTDNGNGTEPDLLAVRLHLRDEQWHCVAVFLRYHDGPFTLPAPSTVRLMADTPLIRGPGSFTSQGIESASTQELEPLPFALSMVMELDRQKRFLHAAMHVCNETAGRFSASRVSLGWLEGRYVRLRATSHAQKVNRKLDTSRLLEAAMEESLDQDDEITWPPEQGSFSINRDHEVYARRKGVAYLASAPLRLDEEACATLTVERQHRPFSVRELDALRLTADVCARRLSDLKDRDRWFGARLGSAIGHGFARVLGVEHTWLRLGALATAAVIATLILYPWPYRVEAPFSIKPRTLVHVPAPYDGFIDKVGVDVGAAVEAGAELAALGRREFELLQAELRASVERYQSEARLARSEGRIAQVHISLARADEARAQLKKAQYNLSLASMRAPFEGIVIEGDLKERVGSPVTKGDPLFKMARLEDLYVELWVAERDVQDVAVGALGALAFASDPQQKFAFKVEAIEPAAVAGQDGNHFVARGTFMGPPQPWWRPGMTGLVKVDVEDRRLLWVLTHRMMDFLRLQFWF